MLKINNFSKTYSNGHVAIANLNLTVEAGDIYAFIGSNGSGKTSTIKAIVGIHDFDGEIIVNGKKVSRKNETYKKDIAYIPDNPDVYENLTGFQYVNFVSDLYEVAKNVREEKLDYFSNLFEMKSFLNNTISSYSHGMKQKLCLVASLIHSPKVWVLDEPTVGLDIMAVEELKKMLREYANHNNTVFVTSHNIELVSKICDKVAIINDGKVVALYDLNKNPNKRLQLSKIFLDTYGG